MKPVETITGTMMPLLLPDIDTDQIVPKQFLKRTSRSGFGDVIFFDWRKDPGFVLNDERYANARVLVAGANFGTGSSREHAPWGLQEFGFEAILAPTFADIFRSNCVKIGLLPVELSPEAVLAFGSEAMSDPSTEITVDLMSQEVRSAHRVEPFEMDLHTKEKLLRGLDDIAVTLTRDEAIADFEKCRPVWMPVTLGT